jgi:hypothetical protein
VERIPSHFEKENVNNRYQTFMNAVQEQHAFTTIKQPEIMHAVA